jgi:hypothetical protein
MQSCELRSAANLATNLILDEVTIAPAIGRMLRKVRNSGSPEH